MNPKCNGRCKTWEITIIRINQVLQRKKPSYHRTTKVGWTIIWNQYGDLFIRYALSNVTEVVNLYYCEAILRVYIIINYNRYTNTE